MAEEPKGTPNFEETELVGNPIRLQLLRLLDNMKELTVEDLAEMVGMSVLYGRA